MFLTLILIQKFTTKALVLYNHYDILVSYFTQDQTSSRLRDDYYT